MKTSASETRLIDNYIQKQLPPAEQLVFEVRLLLCPELSDTVIRQQQVHQLVKLRGRKQLKEQIKMVEQKIFSEPLHHTFRDRIYRLFKK
ncbi:hypothetical protein [Mucilaginibacter sp. CSA2-8R]|uniref:hypothetical protein n=1 Tax=Mucilaginibacter sp. CSA2-8R TaxID=3141542 RepID=UPI00315DE068